MIMTQNKISISAAGGPSLTHTLPLILRTLRISDLSPLLQIAFFITTKFSSRSPGASKPLMNDRGWERTFDDPILLPDGRKLITHDVATFITKLPKREHDAPEWQAAIEALMLVVDVGGPTMFARISVVRALNQHHEPVIEPCKKRVRVYAIVR